MRNLDEQMDLFNPRSSNFEPIEPLPKNPITGEPELTEPLPDPNAPEYKAMRKEFFTRAAKTAPAAFALGVGDIVDLGDEFVPSIKDVLEGDAAYVGPSMTTSLGAAFDVLSDAGISRENAEKLYTKLTGYEFTGHPGELAGEIVGLPVPSAVTSAIAKTASKYAGKVSDHIDDIVTEVSDMFRAATPGGDDFDGMAPATVSTGTTIKTSTDFERPSVFRIFGGTQGRTANTRIKKAEEAEKVDSDPEYVFKESSVFRGEDKQIRYEIATKDAELLPYFKKQGKVDDHPEIKDDKGNVVQEQMYQVFEDPSMKRKIVLADVIKFDELFKEYPHLKGMQVRRLGDAATEDGTRAMYDPFDRVIYVADLEEEQFISSLLHEIQHAVDHFEGRQYGASPTMFSTDAMREATSKLDQLRGERNNFFHFITNKETSENFEKYTPDELDTLRSNEFQLFMSSVYSDRYINDEAFDHFRKKFDPIIAKFADWEQANFQKLVKLRNEYDILEKQANIDEKEAFRKYRSAGGEVDARNVQIRRSKPETQLNVLPSKTADMPKDLDLVDKFGKPVSLPEKSPLRVLFDELPEMERAMLPPQPDANRLYGYHGTASARGADEPFFDINFARTNDQFLGEGFYFTLDPEIASEYASIRGIGTVANTSETRVTPKDLRVLVADTNVKPEYRRNVDSKKRDTFGNPVPTGTLYKTPEGQYYSMSGLQKGEDIYGQPIAKGQSISRFDLSNLKKPYVVRTEKQRKELKAKIPELKEQGYDSVLFADFKDRSKQIMVFPEHMDKIDTSSIAGRSASASSRKIGNPEYDAIFSKLDELETPEEWQSAAKNLVSGERDITGMSPVRRTPELEQSARDLIDNKLLTREEHLKNVAENKPITEWTDLPRQPSSKAMVFSLKPSQRENGLFLLSGDDANKLGVNQTTLKDGDIFNGRLDIPAYQSYDTWVVAGTSPAVKTANGKGVTTYAKAIHYTSGDDKPVKFIASQKTSEGIGKGEKPKTGYATISGRYKDTSEEELRGLAEKYLNDPEWSQVGFDPRRLGTFYLRRSTGDYKIGTPVTEADEVIQIGPLVLAKNAKLDPDYQGYNKGGVVPMDRQMDMFADGGLEQDGGTNDPVSGNEVPPGSTQEEVRDDIPAQLSEGEFVFPADVVRFIGLNKLMQMRQEAKMGLKMMEEMGQMGNSEEATMPDDLPFDINDLDMDDEPEYNVGGFVPGTQQDQQMGIAGYQAAPMPTTSYATQPVQAASQQFVQPVTRPAQAYVPTQQVPTPMPTFGEITGPGVPEVDFEFATFRNEAGQEIQLRIKKGSQGELLPGEVLPEGYSWVDPTATTTEEVTTTPTAVQTARVREDDPSDPPETPGGATVAFGGTLNRKGSVDGAYLGNISYDGLSFGEARSRAMGGFGQFFSEDNITPPLPEGATAIISNLKLPKDPGDIRPAEVMNAQLQVDSNFFNKTIANTNVTDRRDLEETVDYIRDKYSDDFLNDSDNIINVQQEFRQMQAEKDAKVARQQLDEARRRSDQGDDSGFDAIIDAARRQAEADIARDYGGDDDDLGFVDSSPSSSSSSGNRESSSVSAPPEERAGGPSSRTGTDRAFSDVGRFGNKGMLVTRKKPKTKKMKRGGLASKK